MRSPMDETTYLGFYRNTVLGYSKAVFNHICTQLEREHRIVFDGQTTLEDRPDAIRFDDKRDQKKIILDTTLDRRFSGFYEGWEFSKLYKYSVPLFFELPEATEIGALLESKGIGKFDKEHFEPIRVLNTSLKDSEPMYWECKDGIFIKFVLQKYYYNLEPFEQVDYRYPVVLYFDLAHRVVDIRYDAIRYSSNDVTSDNSYEALVNECINWMQRVLGIELHRCEHADFIQTINDRDNAEVKIFRQMMELSSGGSAELTASEGTDYILPFTGELRELIEENDALFSEAEDIKKLLLKYLADKEETAWYPYVYVKWVKPVESQSYLVKFTFDFLSQKYTLLQHLTGICKDLGMGRMNDAIQYLCEHGSIVKGEKIEY